MIRRTGSSIRAAWPALPALGFLAVIFLFPIGRILGLSLIDPTWSLDNYRNFFTSPVYPRVLVNTLLVATIVTLVSLVIAYPYAYLMTRVSGRWTALLLFVVLIPFWTSILVRSFAWLVLLQDTGLINRALMALGIIQEPLSLIRNNTGVIIGTVHVLLPFMIIPLYSNMRGIDTRLIRAAEGLGARPSRAFLTVHVPLSMPGVVAGCLLTFTLTLGFYITPALLGSPANMMLAELIVQQVTQLLNWGLGATVAAVLLFSTLVMFAVVGILLSSERGLGRLR